MTGPSTADPAREGTNFPGSDSGGIKLGEGDRGQGRALVLIASVLALLMPVLDYVVIPTGLSEIQGRLNPDAAGLQRITDAYTLALAAFLLVAGSLADVYGRKRALVWGVLIFTLAAAGSGLAESVDQVVVARAAQGAGGALIVSASLSLLAATFRGGGRGPATGIWAVLSAAALAGAPLLGVYVVEDYPGESVFFLSVPAGLLALLFALPARESRDIVPFRRLDFLGSVAGTAAFAYLTYALVNGAARGWRDESVVQALGWGGGLLLLFLLIESRRRSPALPLRFFRNSSFTVATVAALAAFFGWYAVTHFVPLLLQNSQALSPTDAAERLLPFVATILVLTPLAGWIADRFGARVPLALGCAMAAGGMELLLQSSVDLDYERDVLPALLVLGVGMAFALGAVTIAALVSAGVRHGGIASGVTATARIFGALLGLALLGTLATDSFNDNLRSGLTSGGLDEATARSIVDAPPAGGPLGAFRRQLPEGTPPPVSGGVEQAAQQAAVDAFHTAFLISAGFLVLAAIASAIFVRSHPRPRTRLEATRPEEERPRQQGSERAIEPAEAAVAAPAPEGLAATTTAEIDQTPAKVSAPAEAAPPRARREPDEAEPSPARREPEEPLKTALFELPFKAGAGSVQETLVDFLLMTLPFEEYFVGGPQDTKLPSGDPDEPVRKTSADIATLTGYLLLEQRFGRVSAGIRPELAATSLIGAARALRRWDSGEDEGRLPDQAVRDMVAMLMKGIGGEAETAR